MYYKIQPEQIQLHAFSSPSGHLSFSSGSNYVYANLADTLTGNFNITGSLSINGQRINFSDPSNTVPTGLGNFAFGGVSNTVGGTGSVVLNGDLNTVLGKDNVVLNGDLNTFSSSSEKNTILAGRSASFASGTTGAAILKDFGSYAVSDNGNNSLTIAFDSGVFYEGGKVVFKSSDVYLDPSSSGIFSGNCNFLGSIYKSGVDFATTGDIGVTSGVLDSRLILTGSGLSSRVASTGSSLDSRIILTGSGLHTGLLAVSGATFFKTGDQSVTGENTFIRNTIFSESLYLKGNSGVLSGVSGASALVPDTSGSSIGSRGLVSYSGQFLYLKVSDNPHHWLRVSGDLEWV